MRVKILSANSPDSLEREVNNFLEDLANKNPVLNINMGNIDIEYQVFVHPSGIVTYSVLIAYV